jgi:hypothetical protein
MQHPSITLIASAMLLSISTSWAATPIPLPTDPPRHPGQPAPEVLPIPLPEPPRHVRQPAPANNPVPMPEPPRAPAPPPESLPLPLP